MEEEEGTGRGSFMSRLAMMRQINCQQLTRTRLTYNKRVFIIKLTVYFTDEYIHLEQRHSILVPLVAIVAEHLAQHFLMLGAGALVNT